MEFHVSIDVAESESCAQTPHRESLALVAPVGDCTGVRWLAHGGSQGGACAAAAHEGRRSTRAGDLCMLHPRALCAAPASKPVDSSGLQAAANPDVPQAARLTMPARGRVTNRALGMAGCAPRFSDRCRATAGRRDKPALPLQPGVPPAARCAAAMRPRAESGHPPRQRRPGPRKMAARTRQRST